LISLYTRRGYRIEVECTPDKRVLFEAAGATVIESGAEHVHAWGYPSGGTHEGRGNFWQGSKIGHNISEAPLPHIGDKAELWDELCSSRIEIQPHLSADAVATARRWLERLPRPIVLFHQKGNTAQERKSLPDEVTSKFYEEFINQCDGTLVLLDWDQRVPRLASHRVRHLTDLGPCPIEVLLAMMTQADLMIGVDSGPLHLSRFTNIPTIGLWQPGHYPTTYTLPRSEQLNVVLAEQTRQWNKFKRIPWNIYEHPGNAFDARILADITQRMLGEPRYLRSPKTLAADLQLQQFIQEFCRCRGTSGLATFWDRNRSFDVLFREAATLFESPMIVETGTIRAAEDFGGAGFFTYIAAAFLLRHGGQLHSVDLNPQNVAFAREWTAVFGDTVTIHHGDAIAFLANFSQPIDVLYLDSLDTTEPGHGEHAMRELEAALPKLHNRSLIAIDDTPWQAGSWVGKGARVVPWLLEQGWQVLYAGYQVLLSRS
jgi:predicted O-methyltransferase YrrM